MHVAMDVQCFNSVQKEFVSVMDELETSSVHPCNASKLVVSKMNFVVNDTLVNIACTTKGESILPQLWIAK